MISSSNKAKFLPNTTLCGLELNSKKLDLMRVFSCGKQDSYLIYPPHNFTQTEDDFAITAFL